MSETRTIEQVRAEITTQRTLLAADVDALREEARAVLPYAAGGLVALALLTKGRSVVSSGRSVYSTGRSVTRAYKLLRLLR